MSSGWIGVDFDGTLVKYEGWQGVTSIGDPIPLMVERVKAWIAKGQEVRIMTARVYSNGTLERNNEAQASRHHIQEWCVKIFGVKLAVTCTKDYAMIELWDDRCVQVIPNTGIAIQDLVKEQS